MSFKKVYESWDIKDWKEVAPSFERFYNEEVSNYEIGKHIYSRYYMHNPPDKNKSWNVYQRCYVRK